MSAAWYCCHYLPPVSTGGKFVTGVKNANENGGKFANGVADTDGKFAAGVVDTGGNFAAGVVDTCGKFATGVVDTGGAPWLANISTNFRKNSNGLNGILWGWGETDSWKKPEAKNLVTLSL